MTDIARSDGLYLGAGGNGKHNVVKAEPMYPFYMVVIYLFLEFARPQTLIPVLQYLHLPAITVVLIAISLLVLGKLNIKDNQTVLYLLLLLEMIVHGPIAVNNYWAFTVFYSMSITFIAYLGIVNLVDNDNKYDTLIKYWIITFIFLAIYGYFNADLHLPKYKRTGIGVGGFIGDANDYCMALNTILPFAVFGIFTAKRNLQKFYFIFLVCLFLFIIILTESRGGFIGLVSVATYCWLRSNKKLFLAALMGLLIVFALAVAPGSYWDEIQSIKTENTEANPYGTGAQRVYSWKLGWKMFLENPIIGVGQGNYPWNVGETEEQQGVTWKTRSIKGRAAHSLYFTLLPELGIVGSILYVLMIFFSFKDLKNIKDILKKNKGITSDEYYKKVYYLALALEASLIGFLVSSVFISTLYYPNFWLLCAFIVALKRIIHSNNSNNVLLKTKTANAYL
jgi:O-antigen ligase